MLGLKQYSMPFLGTLLGFVSLAGGNRATSTDCIKCRSPIDGDGLLRRNQRHSAFADKLTQPRFDAVFRVWGCTGFDPQVAGIVRVPAKFEWHEVVVLNIFQRARVPVRRGVLALFDLGDGSRRAD